MVYKQMVLGVRFQESQQAVLKGTTVIIVDLYSMMVLVKKMVDHYTETTGLLSGVKKQTKWVKYVIDVLEIWRVGETLLNILRVRSS